MEEVSLLEILIWVTLSVQIKVSTLEKNRYIQKRSETIILCKCVSDNSRNNPYDISILNSDGGHLGFLISINLVRHLSSLNYHS